MFHTRSPYSPFFTSGLLSPQTSPTASLSDYDFTPRRGSLPSDAPPSYASSTADDASMFYFTLQPARDKDQYRSFLSLDLAESLSLRSHSTKRTREREPPFAVDFQIPDSPSVLPPMSPVSIRSRRTASPVSLLSPKPAPSFSLPTPPSPLSPSSLHVQVIPRSPTPVMLSPLPPLINAAPPQRKASIASAATRLSATTSTTSTRYRRTRRRKALDALEGRRPAVPRPPSLRDFMSMSEDEEDEEEEEDDSSPGSRASSALHLSLSDDALILLIARLEDGDLRSAPSPPTHSAPSSKHENSRRSSTSPSSPRRRKPVHSHALKSFMDFTGPEDASPHWRSFIAT